jgi:membrane protein
MSPEDDPDLTDQVEKGLYLIAAGLAAFLILRSVSGPSRPPLVAAIRSDPPGVDRGRDATAPSQIPLRGWKDILARAYHGISDDRILALAAGSTYYALLSIFPALAALVAIYGLFSDTHDISRQLDALQGVLPAGAIDVLGNELKRLASRDSSSLNFALVTGLLVAVWSANSGVKALFDALNQVYGERETRSFVRLNLLSLAFTISALLFVILALAAVIVLPIAVHFIGLPEDIATTAQVLRWPILLVTLMIALAFVYRYGPDRQMAQWRWVSWGSGVASILWLTASLCFSWYASSFADFDRTYGSLGAVIGFMIWIWVSMIVILLGAELDAEMEHQTTRDTTTGRPLPMGQRGAYMADTFGAAQD